MTNLEASIVERVGQLLKSKESDLAHSGVTYRGPELEVWRHEKGEYTSEIRVTILKNNQIDDVLEFHIFRDGKPMVTTEQAVEWFSEQLAAMRG